MRLSPLVARADLVGRRVRVEWSFHFAAGETLASLPAVRVRRKRRDFQYPAAEPGQPDPFLLFDSAEFPPQGTVAGELPLRERFDEGRRVLTRVTSARRMVGGTAVEALRLTETTTWDAGGQLLSREVVLLDAGGTLGGLVPGTPYYYEISGAALPTEPDVALRRASATPGEAYALGRTMYEMLPAIHHRHDTLVRPAEEGADPAVLEAIPEALARSGQLRRFVDLFGAPLDLMRSTAEGLRNVHDVDNADERFLPWLARWIGWNPSFGAPIPMRRHEIKYAPALYRLTGTIPAAVVWTRLATGWQSRVKEYTHNVFHANAPERLTLWAAAREAAAAPWTEDPEPLVLDTAHEGRPAAATLADGTVWIFYQTFRMNRWGIWFKTWHEETGWTSSQPLTAERTLERAPAAAAMPDGSLRVWWAAYDEAKGRWSVRTRTRAANGTWGPASEFGDPAGERRDPAAAVDGSGNPWLFWMERSGRAWTLRYAREQGGTWSAPVAFPGDGGAPARAEGQPFVVAFATEAPARRLWVFWERREAGAEPGQTRRVLVCRTKADLNPNAGGWSPFQLLSALPPQHHDADPAAFVNAEGRLELFWASTRAEGWSVWSRLFNAATGTWGKAARVTADASTQRHPLPFRAGTGTLLLHRSNRPPVFRNPDPGAIRSVDFRYAGSTTAHTANPEKAGLRGSFDDFGAYTFDTGSGGARGDADRYAHDTVGLFVDPQAAGAGEVATGIGRIRQVLPDALPVVRRAVLAVESGTHAEWVYDYGRSAPGVGRRILEGYADEVNSVLVAEAFPEGMDFGDEVG